MDTMNVLSLVLMVLQRTCVTETVVVFSCDFGRGPIETYKGSGLHPCGITTRDWGIFNNLGQRRYGVAKSQDDSDRYYVLKGMNDMGRFTLPPLQTKTPKMHLSFLYRFTHSGLCGFEVTDGRNAIPINPDANSETGWLRAEGITFSCGGNANNTCPTIVFQGTCGLNTGVVAVDDIVVESFEDLPTTLDTSSSTTSGTTGDFEITTSQKTARPNTTTTPTTRQPHLSTIPSGRRLNIPYPIVMAVTVIMLIIMIGLLTSIFSSRKFSLQKWRAMFIASGAGFGAREGANNVYVNLEDLLQGIGHSQEGAPDHYIPMMPRTQRRQSVPPLERNVLNDVGGDDHRTEVESDDEYVTPGPDLYVNSHWVQHFQSASCCELPQTSCNTGNFESLVRHGSTCDNSTVAQQVLQPTYRFDRNLEFFPNPTYAPFEML